MGGLRVIRLGGLHCRKNQITYNGMKKLTIILFLVALFTSQALGHKQEEEWVNFVVIAIITIMNNVDDMLLA